MYIRDGAQHVITKVHTGKIERIDTEIEQGSATEFWTDDALLMFDAIAECGCENTRLAYDSAFHHFLYLMRHWHIARPYRFGHEHSTFFGKSQKLLCLACIGSERLLYKTRLAVGDGKAGVSEVVRMGSRNIDEIYGRVANKLLV